MDAQRLGLTSCLPPLAMPLIASSAAFLHDTSHNCIKPLDLCELKPPPCKRSRHTATTRSIGQQLPPPFTAPSCSWSKAAKQPAMSWTIPRSTMLPMNSPTSRKSSHKKLLTKSSRRGQEEISRSSGRRPEACSSNNNDTSTSCQPLSESRSLSFASLGARFAEPNRATVAVLGQQLW
jgi:hypothetical protein